VLQIVTKMYFRPGVPLASTVHRDVLYTNRSYLTGETIELPVGELAPSTGAGPVSSVTVSMTEHLEAEQPDGEPDILIATAGNELIDDLADLLSFGLNSTFSREHDLVRRLVPASLEQRGRTSAAGLFRHTFDPGLALLEPELDDLRGFMSRLLALERPSYEAAMRAIRRVVPATRRAADDPTIACTDLVAALESPSMDEDALAPTWQQMDGRKRTIIDAALRDADPELCERIRNAVMEAERLGAANRFVQFVLKRVSPEFFRAEAAEAIHPIRGADLKSALRRAYDVRSLNVHSLWDLSPEAWVFGDRADTVSPGDIGMMLSLEGLARLARHVMRAYVDEAPASIDSGFDWRASLPGKVMVTLAPQHWIHHSTGFTHASAARYFRGFVEHMLDVLAARESGVTNMHEVLARIERLVPGTADGLAKTSMVAMYALWHRVLVKGEHRPDAEAFLARHEHHLHAPTMTAFVTGFLTNDLPEWSTDEWITLATQRRADRLKEKAPSLPAALDGALQACAAERLINEGRGDEAMTFAQHAVEELPGNDDVIAWEGKVAAGEATGIDLRRFILGNEPDREQPAGGSDVESASAEQAAGTDGPFGAS
jgi:hypothetical protein